MTRMYAALLAIFLLTARAGSAQTAATPPSAIQVVKAARGEAASSHRKVFILFHASWCGWCHQMDSIMTKPACKQLFTDHYVIRHLVIFMLSPNAITHTAV